MFTRSTKRDGVEVMIIETGEKFNSIQACANYLGVNGSWLRHVVNRDPGYYTCHGYHVISLDNNETDNFYKSEHRGRPGQKIRITETGEVFESISDCARSINGSVGSIHDALYNNRNRTTYRGLHFEFAD